MNINIRSIKDKRGKNNLSMLGNPNIKNRKFLD